MRVVLDSGVAGQATPPELASELCGVYTIGSIVKIGFSGLVSFAPFNCLRLQDNGCTLKTKTNFINSEHPLGHILAPPD